MWALCNLFLSVAYIFPEYNTSLSSLSPQVYEAISVLSDAGLFKDALCLARVRLSSLDPVLPDLFRAWAVHQTKDQNLEPAAKW